MHSAPATRPHTSKKHTHTQHQQHQECSAPHRLRRRADARLISTSDSPTEQLSPMSAACTAAGARLLWHRLWNPATPRCTRESIQHSMGSAGPTTTATATTWVQCCLQQQAPCKTPPSQCKGAVAKGTQQPKQRQGISAARTHPENHTSKHHTNTQWHAQRTDAHWPCWHARHSVLHSSHTPQQHPTKTCVLHAKSQHALGTLTPATAASVTNPPTRSLCLTAPGP